MQNQLWENMFAYKKTAALFAAFQLGLFRQIKEYGILKKDMCYQLGWNESYTELLCIYLVRECYLTEVDSGWQLNKNFEKMLDSFEEIYEHENTLYHKWLSPDMIVSAVQSDTDKRLFDQEGFSSEELNSYNKTMYGNNVNLIAFHLLRKIRHIRESPVRCLEYGRSTGRIGQAVKKYIPKLYIDVVTLGQNIETQLSYDLILIFNSIHYKTPQEWKIVFDQLKKILKEDGFICIIDVFFEEGNFFLSTVLLDWITHGGIYNTCSQEVIDQLRSIGFTKVEHQFIDTISTTLLFTYK